jgi:hypothetical protein
MASKYELGGTCAWRGCRKTFKGELPHDWIRLCAYWSALPETAKMVVDVAMSPFCKRNTVLCSEHAAELEGMLKPPDSTWKGCLELDSNRTEADAFIPLCRVRSAAWRCCSLCGEPRPR